jgi:hypothetical protein
MQSSNFDASILCQYLHHRQIADMSDLQRVLGTDSTLTVFRIMRQFDYLNSYTHRGRFFTLSAIARFDDRGLWSHEDVWFSRYGCLLATVEAFVIASPDGYCSRELSDLLHTEVRQPLQNLAQQGRLKRIDIDGHFLYSANRSDRLIPALRKRLSSLIRVGRFRISA